MIRFTVVWPLSLVVRTLSIVGWIVTVGCILGGLGILYSLDYDIDVGGGVSWSNYGIRTGIGLGLFVAAFPSGALANQLWKLGVKMTATAESRE